MRHRFLFVCAGFWVVLGVVVATAPAGSGAVGDEDFQRLSAVVRKAMTENAVPGVAIGLLHEGRRATQGFGVTSVDNPLEVTDDTLFQIGSISKTFTGTAIMRLVEAGRIDLDAPIRTYLPDFRVADEEASRKATVRHLLTHMSGWVGDYFDTTGEGDDALKLMMGRMADLEQLAPVGTVWSYNNSGFYVAGRVIEVVTGTSYAEALQELVLDPLGLDRAYVRPADIMTRRFVVGHVVNGDGIQVARPWALYRAAWAAGGVTTSVRQLLDYGAFHLGDGRNRDGKRVLSEAGLRSMRARQALKAGQDGLMGLTWQLDDIGSTRTVSHGGSTVGQIAMLTLVPERDFGLAILTNATSGRVLTRTVTRWALKHYLGVEEEDPRPRESSAEELRPYVGSYRRPMADVEVTLKGKRLIVQRVPREAFPTPASPVPAPGPRQEFGLFAPDRIVQVGGATRAEFVRRPDGSIGWLRLGGRIHVRQ